MGFGNKYSHSGWVHRPVAQAPVPILTKFSRLESDWAEYSKPLTLTLSQQRFVQVFFEGHNCLLSGEAGTGKSYLIKALFAFLTVHRVKVGVTATTGVAALNVGGQTLHSFCGLGLADEPVANLIAKLARNGKAKARMRAIDVLFIDEISMAKGDLLEKVDGVLRSVRRSDSPFGGVQLVCIGDFCQLSPVFKGDDVQTLAFTSSSWLAADIRTVVLKEQIRQKGDAVLLKVLNDLRVGNTSSLHLLHNRVGATFPKDGIDPIYVFTHNADVDAYNAERLNILKSQTRTYYARDTGDERYRDAFNRNCLAPQELVLKVGAQVMCLINRLDEDIVNGSIGVVTAFGPSGVTVRFRSGLAVVELNEWTIKEQEVAPDGTLRFKTVASRSQIPLRLAWGASIHKTQGMTLDRVVIDVSKAFADGMVYVGLSRVRDIESLSLVTPISPSVVRANPECVAFYRDIEEQNKSPA